jgi:3-methyladenine DNA glycosylase/8-oxoguanine DNA glycosylase
MDSLSIYRVTIRHGVSPAKPNPKQVQATLERYRPYRSLAAAHLWASLHLSV